MERPTKKILEGILMLNDRNCYFLISFSVRSYRYRLLFSFFCSSSILFFLNSFIFLDWRVRQEQQPVPQQPPRLRRPADHSLVHIPDWAQGLAFRPRGTGCSLNIVFFLQEFSKVCHPSLASTRLQLVLR